MAGEPYLTENRKEIWRERIMRREKSKRILVFINSGLGILNYTNKW